MSKDVAKQTFCLPICEKTSLTGRCFCQTVNLRRLMEAIFTNMPKDVSIYIIFANTSKCIVVWTLCFANGTTDLAKFTPAFLQTCQKTSFNGHQVCQQVNRRREIDIMFANMLNKIFKQTLGLPICQKTLSFFSDLCQYVKIEVLRQRAPISMTKVSKIVKMRLLRQPLPVSTARVPTA